jgi:hypothetical protein
LIGELLAALSPTELEGLLGSTLTGEPFSKTTVGELASSIGTTTGSSATQSVARWSRSWCRYPRPAGSPSALDT